MKNYFLIHGSFGNSKEHYLPWLKTELEKQGETVYAPDFPIGLGNQNYENWSKVLDKFKDKISKETVFVGRSLAPIFIVRYLLENNLKIDSLFSVSGFNGIIGNSEYDQVNSSFFMKNYSDFKNLSKNRVCFISKNDPYVPLELLEEFATNIDAKIVMRENAGHFNTDSGYDKFTELLKLILNKY